MRHFVIFVAIISCIVCINASVSYLSVSVKKTVREFEGVPDLISVYADENTKIFNLLNSLTLLSNVQSKKFVTLVTNITSDINSWENTINPVKAAINSMVQECQNQVHSNTDAVFSFPSNQIQTLITNLQSVVTVGTTLQKQLTQFNYRGIGEPDISGISGVSAISFLSLSTNSPLSQEIANVKTGLAGINTIITFLQGSNQNGSNTMIDMDDFVNTTFEALSTMPNWYIVMQQIAKVITSNQPPAL